MLFCCFTIVVAITAVVVAVIVVVVAAVFHCWWWWWWWYGWQRWFWVGILRKFSSFKLKTWELLTKIWYFTFSWLLDISDFFHYNLLELPISYNFWKSSLQRRPLRYSRSSKFLVFQSIRLKGDSSGNGNMWKADYTE